MKLSLISETNLVRTNTARKIGKAVGIEGGKAVAGHALGAAAGVIGGVTAGPIGLAVGAAATKLTWQIINFVKNKKRADHLIMQAMSLPDSDRDELNIFDIDDNLWDDGILNKEAINEIHKIVKTELVKYVAKGATLPPDFANAIAIKFVQSKIKPNATQSVQA